MNRKLLFLVAIIALIGSFAFAQDLKIETQIDVTGTARTNYSSFEGPIRYIANDKDHFDGRTGASVKGTTHLFQPYRVDVLGKAVLPDAIRSTLLYGVNGPDSMKEDNLTVEKARTGEITVQFSHRGTAYRYITDRNGNLDVVNGTFQKRTVGYISGHGPQVISTDFARNGQANTIQWDKVWDPSVRGGSTVDSSGKKTGNLMDAKADPNSMFYWKGVLKVTFERNVLRVSGGLDAVKR